MKKFRIKNLVMICAIALFVMGLVSCTPKTEQSGVSKTAIIQDINGKPLEFDQFRDFYIFTVNNLIRHQNIKSSQEWDVFITGEIKPSVTRDSYIRNLVLDQIIDLTVVSDYMQKEGKSVSQEEINTALENHNTYITQFAPDLMEYYKLNNISDDTIKNLLEKMQYWKKFEDLVIEEVKKEYAPDSAKLNDTVIRVEASHILLKTEDEAKDVLNRINKGEDFAALAQELSEDKVSGEAGGELGYFDRGTMIKEFSDAAFSMQVGEVSQPVKSEFGYHIIKVTGRETYADIKEKSTDADELNRVYDGLIFTQSGIRLHEKLDELKKDLKLDVNDEILNQKIDVQIPSVKHEDVPADDNKDDNSADSDNGTDTDKNSTVDNKDETDKKDNSNSGEDKNN